MYISLFLNVFIRLFRAREHHSSRRLPLTGLVLTQISDINSRWWSWTVTVPASWASLAKLSSSCEWRLVIVMIQRRMQASFGGSAWRARSSSFARGASPRLPHVRLSENATATSAVTSFNSPSACNDRRSIAWRPTLEINSQPRGHVSAKLRILKWNYIIHRPACTTASWICRLIPADVELLILELKTPGTRETWDFAEEARSLNRESVVAITTQLRFDFRRPILDDRNDREAMNRNDLISRANPRWSFHSHGVFPRREIHGFLNWLMATVHHSRRVESVLFPDERWASRKTPMLVRDDPMTQTRGIAAVKVHRRACSAKRRDSERRDGPLSFAADENSRSNSHLWLSSGDRRPVQRYHRGLQGRHASYAGRRGRGEAEAASFLCAIPVWLSKHAP